jgi:hypothetical protein
MKKIITLLCVLFTGVLFAQQVTLFEQFNGQYDYLAFGNTLNQAENNADQISGR